MFPRYYMNSDVCGMFINIIHTLYKNKCLRDKTIQNHSQATKRLGIESTYINHTSLINEYTYTCGPYNYYCRELNDSFPVISIN